MTGYNKIKHGIIILFYSFELWAQNEFGPKNAYFTMSNNRYFTKQDGSI